MICNSTSNQWKPALRKILAIVFGHQVLSTSCAVGRTNANPTPSLDGRKLNIIKSVVNQFAKTAFPLSKEFHIFPSAALSIIVKHYNVSH